MPAQASPLLAQISNLSRTEHVAKAIKEAILRGELPPGAPLVERDLAELLGVSKTPVREALKLLSRSGLVTSHVYRGATVRTVDKEMARWVYEVRLLLEPEAVQQSVPRFDSPSLTRLRDALREAAEAGRRSDYATLSLANRRFHRELYAPCDNRLLCSLLDDLQDQVALIGAVAWRRRSTWDEEAREHEGICALVEAADAAGVAESLKQHIQGFLTRLLDVL